MPLSNSVVIDRESFLNIIDQMRITIPQEIKRCQEFETERDRYVAQAQDDARAILEQAHEDAARLLDDQAIKKQAELDARRTLERARREADEVRSGADEYAAVQLHELERHVQQLAQIIHNGLQELERQPEQPEDAPAPEPALDDLPEPVADQRSNGTSVES